jgi:chromosome segregation ATPase
MWPKLLLDLLPHFARLAPVADKYFTTRSASDKAQEAALAALSADIRGEMGKVASEQGGLRQQLQEQGEQVAQVAVEATRARMGVESIEARVAKLEKTIGLTVKLLVLALVLLATSLILNVILLTKAIPR